MGGDNEDEEFGSFALNLDLSARADRCPDSTHNSLYSNVNLRATQAELSTSDSRLSPTAAGDLLREVATAARGWCGAGPEADDLAGDALLDILLASSRSPGRPDWLGWTRCVARRAVRWRIGKAARSAKRHRRGLAEFAEAAAARDSGSNTIENGPEHRLDVARQAAAVMVQAATLPTAEYQAVRDRLTEDGLRPKKPRPGHDAAWARARAKLRAQIPQPPSRTADPRSEA